MEKFRGPLELVGLLILSGSLIFVALQMQQDRDIALAELASERHQFHSSRFAAGIESDDYLQMYYALYRTDGWVTGELSDKQIAVAELDALIWWGHINQVYDHYRNGLVEATYWEEQKEMIKSFSKLPVFKAVYNRWWKRSPSDFTDFVDELTGHEA